MSQPRRVVAIMDSGEKKRSGDLTSVGGNFGGPGELMDFSNVGEVFNPRCVTRRPRN